MKRDLDQRCETCLICNDPWSEHAKDAGCMVGWEFDSHGRAVVEGCLCPAAHVELSAASSWGHW